MTVESKSRGYSREVVGWSTAVLAVIASLPLFGNGQDQKVSTPAPSVTLRVAAGSRVLKEDDSIPLKAGQSVRLTVQAVPKDAVAVDVTNNPKTFFLSLTPWALSVSSDGVVTASGSQEYPNNMPEYDIGAVGVRYGAPGDAQTGGATTFFDLTPGAESVNAVGLHVKPAKTTLRVGETMQLTVTEKLPDGTTRDLTSPVTGTMYDTTSESMLIPEPDGRVTCIGTHGERWNVVTVAAQNGKLRRKARLRLLAADAPGPGLEVVADKTELREGDKTQLHVFKPRSGANRRDLAAASTGTRYLTFAGYGFADPSVISISETGLASATDSIGHYNHRTVVVFLRNGNSVGWVELKVTHSSGQ
ncbi:MAG TPA: hypothetical protein VFV34_26025 [Blastocatellia bacterium]|nr:hypothetical protein [Blastocatellia bacterium]